jgi:hypothetical protein
VRFSRGLAAAVALGCAATVAGCGFGPGEPSEGTATLTVTRDYGSRTLVEAADDDPPESETVIRFLDREAEITTRYGGGFVESIDGLGGGQAGGRRSDWFFYVNGIESGRGAADVGIQGGDRIWWDYRDWTDAMRVPAVVGSWPEPFAQASSEPDARRPVSVECLRDGGACQVAVARLREAGASVKTDDGSQLRAATDALRVVVGRWKEVRKDPAVAGLRGGPGTNGVFATFKGTDRTAYRLIALDVTGTPSRNLGSRAGLVAALKPGGEPPTWIVTGSGGPAVRQAASILGSGDLRNRYAVAARVGGPPVALPVERGLGR